MSQDELDALESGADENLPASMKFHSWATSMLEDYQWNGMRTLHYYNKTFWVWTHRYPAYRKITFLEMQSITLAWLRDHQRSSFFRDAEAVTHCLMSDCLIMPSKMPCWLNGARGHKWTMALKNTLIDPTAVAAGKSYGTQAHTPAWFSAALLPYDFEPNATAPVFLAWIEEALEGRSDDIALFQEYLGYLVTPNTSKQAALFLFGDPSTGKTTAAEVIRVLVGNENCSSVEISKMGGRFNLHDTYGKLVNISGEVEQRVTIAAEGAFKMFTGNDSMMFEQKGVQPYQTRPTARLVACLNKWPRINDTTGAIQRRIRLLPFLRVVPVAEQDHALPSKLRREAPGILNWALKGLARLLDNGSFTVSETGARMMRQFTDATGGHSSFVSDMVVAKPGEFVSTRNLLTRYEQWCNMNAVTAHEDAVSLTAAVKKAYGSAEGSRRRIKGIQERGLLNIGLR